MEESFSSNLVSDAVRAAAKALLTVPCKIADKFGVRPEYIELLLAKRGQRCGEEESLRELVARHYGERAAAIVEQSIKKGN